MTERSIPRIDPSGAFLPVARLSLKAPQALIDGVGARVQWVVDYIKGDIGQIGVLDESFDLGPGLYLVTVQAATTAGPTSLRTRISCEDGLPGGNFSETTNGGTTVETSCQAFLPPTDPETAVPGIFAYAIADVEAIGANATLSTANMLIEKFSNLL